MSETESKSILIIGAGPAGLTAGLELVKHGFQVTILEAHQSLVGGISRSEEYKGYRFDIGGHRFYSKNKKIEDFWKEILKDDLLIRKRKSRIFYEGKFYDYPLNIKNSLQNLGFKRAIISILSYLKYKIKPIKPEKSYKDWMINRFGKHLFNIFFKTYTEKIWGISVNKISKDWAIQRVKTFSLAKGIWAAIFPAKKRSITTLIDQFYYPKLGPGMMWERVAEEFKNLGGKIIFNSKVNFLLQNKDKWQVRLQFKHDSFDENQDFDEVISTMPLRSLIKGLGNPARKMLHYAGKLKYRDFITVLLIINKKDLFDDNWIYIHDPKVKVGRIQNFKNWSEFMLPDQNKTSLGLEYFIFENDEMWNMPEDEFLDLAKKEVIRLGFCQLNDIEDGKVIRVKKAYPVYNLTYGKNVNKIRKFLKKFPTLHTIGRNGMHKWNNQDHSMMTGLVIAENIIKGTKKDPWNVNTEAEYGEERKVPLAK